jgi:hypothetical protein
MAAGDVTIGNHGSTNEVRQVALALGVPGDAAVAVSDSDPLPMSDDAAQTLLQDINNQLASTPTALPPVPLLTTDGLTRTLFDFTSTADQDLVAAVAGQTTRVHQLILTCPSAVNLSVYSGGSGGTLLGFYQLQVGLVLDFNSFPHWKTAANAKLTFKASAAVRMSGTIATVTSA